MHLFMRRRWRGGVSAAAGCSRCGLRPAFVYHSSFPTVGGSEVGGDVGPRSNACAPRNQGREAADTVLWREQRPRAVRLLPLVVVEEVVQEKVSHGHVPAATQEGRLGSHEHRFVEGEPLGGDRLDVRVGVPFEVRFVLRVLFRVRAAAVPGCMGWGWV